MVPMFSCYCWRALARKLPILYNGERKAKYVGCKIEDIRSRLCFLIPGHSGVLVNARESIDRFRAIVPLSSKSGKDTINEVKNGCLLLLVEVFIKVMNGLVMILAEGMRFLCVWLLYYVSNFAESYFMRSFFSVYSAAVLGKITSIRSFHSKLPTAACWSREEKRGNCEANLLYVESELGTTYTRDKSFTVVFAR